MLLQLDRRTTFDFVVDGFVKQSGPRATFRIPGAARGKRVACGASGRTAGGGYGSPLATAVLIRR